ncbi:hypothetical protein C6I20_16205 [Aeromicrobium sp. A1-2]|uniref:hypothetical protein n=1 Tax=Aeromicrobium sp. A1-2 TaxID=2107713 RepID=UPI000E50996D|nr:hypothetical protein [Aeromicrobium sp. A1-2]AXT86558.1 hypothetical protein C6I20_16205 [Aeromicrobium sp. A1-2]
MTDQLPDPAAPTGRRTARLVFVGLAVTLVIALAGGAFAVYRMLDGGGAQPHDVLPDSVIGYARIDVDPSASQKIAALRLIRKFPDLAKEIGIKSADQDVRKLIFDGILDSTECDLAYDEDIEPWIGSRLGIGLDKDGKTPLVAIQISDEDKARKGLDALFMCGGDERPGVAFLDGYAVVAEKQVVAESAVKAARTSPLSKDKNFVEDFADLGDQGFASAWGDAQGALDIPGALDGLGGGFAEQFTQGFEQGGGQLDDLSTWLTDARSGALTLRAGSRSLEVVGLLHHEGKREPVKPLPIASLPDSTIAAFSGSGGGASVGKQWNSLVSSLEASGAVGGADIAAFEEQSGFALPEDLETLFGDTLTLALGSANLDTIPTLGGPDDVAGLDIGLVMESDPAKAMDLAGRLVSLVEQIGVPLAVSPTDRGAVIASNEQAAADLGTAGDLGDTTAFKDVIPETDQATIIGFVDIGQILDALSAANPPEEIARQIDQAESLSAFGFSLRRPSDDVQQLSIRLAFTK